MQVVLGKFSPVSRTQLLFKFFDDVRIGWLSCPIGVGQSHLEDVYPPDSNPNPPPVSLPCFFVFGFQKKKQQVVGNG